MHGDCVLVSQQTVFCLFVYGMKSGLGGEKKKGNLNQEFLSDCTSPVFVHLFMKDFHLRLED